MELTTARIWCVSDSKAINYHKKTKNATLSSKKVSRLSLELSGAEASNQGVCREVTISLGGNKVGAVALATPQLNICNL